MPLAVGPAISASGGLPVEADVHRDLDSSGSADARRYFGRRRTRSAARAAHDWVEEGSACDLLLARAPSGARGRWRALIAGVDVVVQPRRAPPQAAARRRHGFDDDRSGMHRRAGRLCRGQGRGRRGDRAGDAGRARFRRRRSMRGSPCSRGSDDGAIDRCHAERVRVTPGAAALVRTMRGERRLLPARLGRLQPASPTGSRRRSASTRAVSNRLDDRGRPAGRHGRASRSSAPNGKLQALLDAAGGARHRRSARRSRSATAPTTFR